MAQKMGKSGRIESAKSTDNGVTMLRSSYIYCSSNSAFELPPQPFGTHSTTPVIKTNPPKPCPHQNRAALKHTKYIQRRGTMPETASRPCRRSSYFAPAKTSLRRARSPLAHITPLPLSKLPLLSLAHTRTRPRSSRANTFSGGQPRRKHPAGFAVALDVLRLPRQV